MIYIDEPFLVTKEAFPNAPRCFLKKLSAHLFADTTKELTDYARSIGCYVTWIQKAGTAFEHFDLTGSKLNIVLLDSKV